MKKAFFAENQDGHLFVRSDCLTTSLLVLLVDAMRLFTFDGHGGHWVRVEDAIGWLQGELGHKEDARRRKNLEVLLQAKTEFEAEKQALHTTEKFKTEEDCE